MKPITEGERLFILIRDEILGSIGNKNVSWSTIGILFNQSGENSQFSTYIRGAVSVHAVRTLLRYWSAEKANIVDVNRQAVLRKFIKRDVYPGLNDHLTSMLARSVIAAESVSSKVISPSVRKEVIGQSQLHNCYLCNCVLNVSALCGQPDYLTLEHLWPSSIGGDSIEENLLPACVMCQNDTENTMSWEWLNIHNLVLPTSPSDDALKSVTRKQRTARHFHQAIAIRDENGISLKQAFLQIGSIKSPLSYTSTGSPITFFDLHTV